MPLEGKAITLVTALINRVIVKVITDFISVLQFRHPYEGEEQQERKTKSGREERSDELRKRKFTSHFVLILLFNSSFAVCFSRRAAKSADISNVINASA